jgi:small ligand-binding sensory domain FIST
LKIIISLSKDKKALVHHALWMGISRAKLYIFSIVAR